MEKYRQIAKYAYEKSIFYREFVGYRKINDGEKDTEEFEFEKLSIISKDDIVDSKVPILPIEYMIHDSNDEVITMSTSGSTGKTLKVEWNKSDYYKSMTELWILRKKYYGINPNDKMCYFYTTRNLGTEEVMESEIGNTLGFSKTSLNKVRMKEIYERICEYQPVWMLLQPSTAQILADVMRQNHLPCIESLKYIEFSGEMLSESLERQVKKMFKCDVANQYGSYEFNSIAYECPYGNMHVVGSNVHVENTEDGEFVITSLTNKRTPFIRYRIGDSGILLHNINCCCGNRNPVIRLTVGRSHYFVECEDGTKLNAYIFSRAVDNINFILDDVVKQFQVIQRAVNDFKVRMYVDDRSQISAIKKIFEENILDNALQNAKFEYSFEEGYIKDEHGDKLMYFRRQ